MNQYKLVFSYSNHIKISKINDEMSLEIQFN